MATYYWSQMFGASTSLNNVALDLSVDRLIFDTVSAASLGIGYSTTYTYLNFSAPDSSGVTKTLILNGFDIRKLYMADGASSSSPGLYFTDGSKLLVGDGTIGTAADDSNNKLTGGAGNDRIMGLGGADTMLGGDGKDTFYALGSDSIDGGTGNDWVTFSNVTSVSINLKTHIATTSDGSTIQLTSVEGAGGTSGADTFIGGDPAHAYLLNGSLTVESFSGSGGNDTIIGAAGSEYTTQVNYNGSSIGSIVDLHAGLALDGAGGVDTLINVAQLLGGTGADQFFGGGSGVGNMGLLSETFVSSAGNDVYNGGVLYNEGLLTSVSGQWHFASRDAVDYSSSTQSINVDLSKGTATDGLGGTDTLININVIYAGSGADTLIGGSDADILDGGAGADYIDGGAGADTARYLQSPAGIVANLSGAAITVAASSSSYSVTGLTGSLTVAASTVYDGYGTTDTLVNIEKIIGSKLNDYIRGSDTNTRPEVFFGQNGDDYIDGGAGVDLAGYQENALSLGGLTLSLAPGADGLVKVIDGRGGVDTLVNIEGFSATNANDTLIGYSGDDYFRGNGGSDIIDGGAGIDTVSYSADPSAVEVDLAKGRAIDGWNGASNQLGLGGVDTLLRIENIDGSKFNDVLIGDAGNNRILGSYGDDAIDGGGGVDTAVYTGSRYQYVVLDRGDGTIVVSDTKNGEGIDTLRNIERLSFSDGEFAVTDVANETPLNIIPSSSAYVTGSSLTINFNKMLDFTHGPNASSFKVSVSGVDDPVESVQVSSTSIKLKTNWAAVSLDQVSVTYTDPTSGNDPYAIQDATGVDIPSFTYGVTNYTPAAVTFSLGMPTATAYGSADSAPLLINASFSEPSSGGSVIQLVFDHVMGIAGQIGITGQITGFADPTLFTVSKAGGSPITIQSATSLGHTVSLATNTTLGPNDVVVVSYAPANNSMMYTSALSDAYNLTVVPSFSAQIGGSGNNYEESYVYNSQAMGNAGADTIVSDTWGSRIRPGDGADVVQQYSDYSFVYFNENTPSVDTLKLDHWTSNPYSYNIVYGFDTLHGTSNDRLDLASGTIAPNVSVTNGADIDGLKSHSIANGVVTFYSTDGGGAPVTISTTTLPAALAYLAQNISQLGTTVGFGIDTDGNGVADSFGVFQQVRPNSSSPYHPLENETFVMLDGVAGATLSNQAGQNVVQIVDTTGPQPLGADIRGGCLVVHMDEAFTLGDMSGLSFKKGSGTTTTSVQVTSFTTVGQDLWMTFDKPIGASEYLSVSVTDPTKAVVKDLFGNTGALSPSTDLVFLITQTGSIADGSSLSAAIKINSVVASDATSTLIVFNPAPATNSGALAQGINGGDGADIIHGSSRSEGIEGRAGNDIIFGHGGYDNIKGGAGADYVDATGGAYLQFAQGDSPLVSVSGSQFYLPNGVDRIVGFSSGSSINIYNDQSMAPSLKMMAAPSNGLVTDQAYFFVRGSYANSVFTTNTTGPDTLLVYDGDPAAAALPSSNIASASLGISQTAILLSGVTPDQLGSNGSNIWFSGSSSPQLAPTFASGYANGNQVILFANKDLDGSHAPATSAFILAGSTQHAVTGVSISGGYRVALTLSTPVAVGETLTLTYTDPTTGDDSSALQDVSGADAASFSLQLMNATVVSATTASTVSVKAPTTSVNEGSTAIFDVTTTGLSQGSLLPWSLAGLDSFDIYGGATAGVATVGADGHATISIGLAADHKTEGTETLSLSVAGKSATATILDTSTSDTLAPTLLQSSPLDGGRASASDNLIFNFSESVKAGAGSIIITNLDSAADTHAISVTDTSQVSFAGSILTIDPSFSLLTNAHYAVTMASGVVVDTSGNAYSGLSGAALDFTTGPNLHGAAYFWKADATGHHALLSGVSVSANGGGSAASATAPIQMKNITVDAAGHLTADVYGHVGKSLEGFDLHLDVGGSANATFSSALSDWTVVNNASNGKLLVSAFCAVTTTTSTAIGAGDVKLGTLSFDAGAASQIHFGLDSGTGIVDGGDSVSAAISGWSLAHSTTGADGSYTMTAVDAGAYALSAGRSASDIGNAISSADALAALKIAVGINPNSVTTGGQLPVSPFQIMAADVNGDGRVNSADALSILKMAVQLPSAPTPQWMFVEETRDFYDETTGLFTLNRTNSTWNHDISASLAGDTGVNVVGVLKGDVNGSWTPPAGSAHIEDLAPNYFQTLSATLHTPITEWGLFA